MLPFLLTFDKVVIAWSVQHHTTRCTSKVGQDHMRFMYALLSAYGSG